MTPRIPKIVLILCVLLLVFLPFSAFLVSISGNLYLSVIRDILVALIFLFSIPSFFVKKSWIGFLPIILFVAFGVASYFWREASLEQWLKGFRFTFLPIILLFTMIQYSYLKKDKRAFFYAVFIPSLVIMFFALMQLFNIQLPLGDHLYIAGSIGEIQKIGIWGGIPRLQSILAGPNALGLYLLVLIGLTIGAIKNGHRLGRVLLSCYLILLVSMLLLTFSRSVLVGLVALLIVYLSALLVRKVGILRGVLTITISMVLLSVGILFALNNPKVNMLVTHGESSTLRVEQYRRIWDSRFAIGLLGKGMGTAGPSSQYRLDGGPNHWSENIYLDIFEELGLIGFIFFLVFYLKLIIHHSHFQRSRENLFIFSLLVSYGIAGLFINNYTGQVGIFLLYLFAGINYNQSKKEEVGL